MKKYFKIETEIYDLQFISPHLLMVMAALVNFCNEEKIPCEFTSIIRPHDSFSKSTTHQTGRAADFRVINLKKGQVLEVDRFLKDYDYIHKLGAINSNGVRRLAVRHNSGRGDHIHIQVKH